MKAELKYRMEYVPHPWDEDARKKGIEAWCLTKVVVAGGMVVAREAVAIFNLDSEGRTFQQHLHEHGSTEVEIDREMRDLFDARRTR